MKHRIIVSAMLVLLGCDWALAQQSPAPTSESHKNRAIFTIAGGGGGFALGVFLGLAAFDDDINSDRKVWTTAVLSAAGGAVGGYFLGRALDKRSKKITLVPDEFRLSLMRSRWPISMTTSATLLPATGRISGIRITQVKYSGVRE